MAPDNVAFMRAAYTVALVVYALVAWLVPRLADDHGATGRLVDTMRRCRESMDRTVAVLLGRQAFGLFTGKADG